MGPFGLGFTRVPTLPSEFRTSQPRLYVLIRLQQSRMIIFFYNLSWKRKIHVCIGTVKDKIKTIIATQL